MGFMEILPFVMQILTTIGMNKAQQDAIAKNEGLARAVLTGYQDIVSGKQSTLTIPGVGDFKLPANQMQDLQEFEKEFYPQLQNINAEAINTHRQYAAKTIADLEQSQGNLLSSYDKGSKGLEEYATARLDRNLGTLDRISDQAKKDIDQGAAQVNAANTQSRTARGLSAGGSVAATERTGVERERGAAQTRLADTMIRERVAIDSALSGDVLNTKASNFGGRMNLLGNSANNMFNLKASTGAQDVALQDAGKRSLFDFKTGVAGERRAIGAAANAGFLNTALGINYPAPDMAAYMSASQGFGKFAGAQQYVNSLPDPGNWFTNMFAPSLVGGTVGGIAAADSAAFVNWLGS